MLHKTATERLELKADAEPGIFEGYASVFGNVDKGGDVVMAGAFAEGLRVAKSKGVPISMLWQHDAREPIGVWEDMAEDAKGLWVRGRLLVDDDPLARRAWAHLKAGSLRGLSIGYSVPAGGAEPDKARPGVVLLKRVNLREVSLVTFPMNERARADAVKRAAAAGQLPSREDFASWLAEVGGFEKGVAREIASQGLPSFNGGEGGAADLPNSDDVRALRDAFAGWSFVE